MAQILRYVEISEETAYPNVDSYTPKAQGDGVYLNIASATMDVPGETQLDVPSAFGRASVETEPGYYAPTGNVAYAIVLPTVGYFLKGLLGGYAFTAGAAGPPILPNIHEFWGSDDRDLPSWLVRTGKDIFEHCFQGCIMESMELTVEDALTNLTTEMNAQKDFKATLQAKTDVQAALPTDRKIPFHQVFLTIDSVLQAKKAKTLTLSLTNGSDPENGRYLGSRYPGRISANERVATASTEMDFSDMAQLEKIWGGANGPTDQGAAEFPAEFEFRGGISPDDTNTTPNKQLLKMIIKFPRANYQTVESQPTGREEMTQPVTLQGRTGTVTLEDGVTEVATDIYAKVTNWEPMIQPPA